MSDEDETCLPVSLDGFDSNVTNADIWDLLQEVKTDLSRVADALGG